MHPHRSEIISNLLVYGTLALAGCGVLWAQNENETVGFQPNHVFENADFGESVDVLNGGLTLLIPIGGSYQVNQNLAYQLALSYTSKVWDRSSWDGNPLLVHQGGAGLGFSLHLGRIYRDTASVWKKYKNNVDPVLEFQW